MIVDHAREVFGPDGIYFDIKKLIGTPKKGATIPDGYFLDLTFHNDPKLYLVEVELNSHDVYGHIGEQILRFGISTETDMNMFLYGSWYVEKDNPYHFDRWMERQFWCLEETQKEEN